MKIFDALFGCWHKNISFPQTHKRGEGRLGFGVQTGTYIVCLDCGREFAYDWKEMRVIAPAKQALRSPSHVEVEAKAS